MSGQAAVTGQPCSRPPGPGALLWPLTHGLERVALMGVLVEEEVVAGGLSGHPRGQLGHVRGLGVHELDRLPLQVQLLRGAVGYEGTRLGSAQAHPPNKGSRGGWVGRQAGAPSARLPLPSGHRPSPNSAPLKALLERSHQGLWTGQWEGP